MAQNIREILEEDYTREEADVDGLLYALLDFVSPGSDMEEVFSELYAGSVVGYYDSDEKEMFVLGGEDTLSPASKHTLAHELIHALQDQHYNLDSFLPEDEENGDLQLAKLALVEGDAVLASLEWVDTHLTRSERRRMYSSSGDREAPDVPPALLQMIYFPYREGASFVTELRGQDGWQAVDAAFADPPASTEQVLHFEKYTDREAPIQVELPTLDAGVGWTIVDEGTLGEFIIGLFLDNRLTDARASNAAAGWGGDTYALLENEEEGVSALVSLSIWDTNSEAQEFFRACESYYRSGRLLDLQDGVRRWETDEGYVHLALDADRVLLVVSDTEGPLDALVDGASGFGRDN